MDVRNTVSGYLDEHKHNGDNTFVQVIARAFREGNLDRNIIRRAVLQHFQTQDHKAVFFGSLLLQLNNKEVHDLLNEKF